MDASVPLREEYLIANTLYSLGGFFVALVLIQVAGWTNFVELSFPGSLPLLTHSFFPALEHHICCTEAPQGQG